VRLARSIAVLSVGALLVGAPAGWWFYDWRVGVGWIVAGVLGGVLSLDVDRVTRESRWQARDAQRDWRRLREARTRQAATRDVACG
jgi:hypothetical protein